MTGEVSVELPAPPPATLGPRMALRVMQLGALAVVLAVSTTIAFELDRFFVPKELVLHLAAFLAGLLMLRTVGRLLRCTRVDLLLAAYLALSALSAIMATNRWLALRALAVSASGILLFLVARSLRQAGLARPLLGALAVAVVLVAMTSLLQTYGLDTPAFAENRAPGGTLGNRNFVAHAAAFGLPLLLLAALRARRRAGFIAASIGITLVLASLVLTRSRAAGLAFGAVVVVFLLALLFSRALRRNRQTWSRLFRIALLVAGGVALALVIPNTLHWRARNPYLQTVKRVTDYQEGSGRGRLVQYEQTLRMAAHHPLFGVGPGNWAVQYPANAARNDPSLSDSEGGMTSNPWPSSDWVACVAERGFPAVALLALVFLLVAGNGLRQLARAADAEEGLLAAALVATVAGVVVTGLLDAVMLLPLPTFLVWSALGALWTPASPPVVGQTDAPQVPVGRSRQRLFMIALLFIAALGAFRSGSQLVGMHTYATRSDRASLLRAARIDPGNYRLRLRLGRMGRRDQRCEHAKAAHALYPFAEGGRQEAAGCGG
jgi:O-antigen ligase